MQNEQFQRRFDRASPQERFRLIKENNLYINFPTSDGETCLHTAVRYNIRDTTDQLLAWPGIDVDVRNGNDKSPLDLAAAGNNPKSLEKLLEAGADVFAVNKQDQTVLHHVLGSLAFSSYSAIFNHLLEPKSKPNMSSTKPSSFFVSIFNTTASGRQSKPVTMSQIYEFIMRKDRSGRRFFDNLFKDPELLKLVLEFNVVADALRAYEHDFYYQLIRYTSDPQSARKPYPDASLQELLADLMLKGHPINAYKVAGCSLLHQAFVKKSINIAQFLIKSGEDPLDRCDGGFTAFHHAVEQGNEKLFKTFECEDPQVLAECYVMAMERNHPQIQSVLLEKGLDLSYPSVIKHAIKSEMKEFVAQLVKDNEYSHKILLQVFKFAIVSGMDETIAIVRSKIKQFGQNYLSNVLFELVNKSILTENEIIKYVGVLVELGANLLAPNSDGKSLLYAVKRSGRRLRLLEKLFKSFECNDPEILAESYVIAVDCDEPALQSILEEKGVLTSPLVIRYAIKHESEDLVARLVKEREYSQEILLEIFKFSIVSGMEETVSFVRDKIQRFDQEYLDKLLFELVDDCELSEDLTIKYICYLTEMGADFRATNSAGKDLRYVAKRNEKRLKVVKHLEGLLGMAEVDERGKADSETPTEPISQLNEDKPDSLESS